MDLTGSSWDYTLTGKAQVKCPPLILNSGVQMREKEKEKKKEKRDALSNNQGFKLKQEKRPHRKQQMSTATAIYQNINSDTNITFYILGELITT